MISVTKEEMSILEGYQVINTIGAKEARKKSLKNNLYAVLIFGAIIFIADFFLGDLEIVDELLARFLDVIFPLLFIMIIFMYKKCIKDLKKVIDRVFKDTEYEVKT